MVFAGIFSGLAGLARETAGELFLALATILIITALFTPAAVSKLITIAVGLLIGGIVVFNPEIFRGIGTAIANVLPQ